MNWNEAIKSAIGFRHWSHQYPELTWEESSTATRIRQLLSEWQIPWRACAEYGTVATLAANAPGEHIALRADMDALPITENAPVDYCSTEAGKMHACGHDGHMAALIGTAIWLKQQEDKLPGPVTLLFQPAEEGGHGAKRMIEDGAETWEAPMPAVVTVDFGCNKPRQPTLTGKIRVKRGGLVAHWSAADLGLEPSQIGLKGSPTIVAKVDTVQLPSREGKIFQEEPTIAVSLLLDALRKDKVIP